MDNPNDEPVWYCADCYSLSLKRHRSLNLDVCQECGNTNVAGPVHIDEWNKLYVLENGYLFLSKEED